MSIKVELNKETEEPFESSLKRFKRCVSQSGHLYDLRRKDQWESKADKVKRKIQKKIMKRKFDKLSAIFLRKKFGAVVNEYNT